MRKILILWIYVALIWAVPLQVYGSGDSTAGALTEKIREKVRAPRTFCIREGLACPSLLTRFYAARKYRPAWCAGPGLNAEALDLIASIGKAPEAGLRPADYHLDAIETLVRKVSKDPAAGADLDLVLTDSFFIYASHLQAGRIDPETIHPQWSGHTRRLNLTRTLESALARGAVAESLGRLHPPHSEYARLQQALGFYRAIAQKGGWEFIPRGTMLRKGDRDRRVALLRRHLEMTGDLTESRSEDTLLLDAVLQRALMKYQQRHNLRVDGILGPESTHRLNVPVEGLIGAIELNMERWRWLPRNLGTRYIRVNIADFSLDVMEKDEPVLSMKIVAGKSYRKTPVFSSNMTYLVINPFWNVPTIIAVEDILPLLPRNPAYLAEQKIKVYESWDDGMPEIDPGRIKWNRLDRDTFPYYFRQAPGPDNPLGRIKFMFPNRFDVYLHDTPHRDLFNRTMRDFSSGCIRIEKPLDLAAYVLQEDERWNRHAIEEAMQSEITQTVPLPRSIPVHILYMTAWTDREGRTHFRRDIYERDIVLHAALMKKPPPL